MATIRPLYRKGQVRHNVWKQEARAFMEKPSRELQHLMMAAGDARMDPRHAVAGLTADGSSREQFLHVLRESDSVPRPSDDSGGQSPAAAHQPRWNYTPVVVAAPVPALLFHHFLHGIAGRSNDRRRPLVSQGCLGSVVDAARQVELRRRAALAEAVRDSREATEGDDSGWFIDLAHQRAVADATTCECASVLDSTRSTGARPADPCAWLPPPTMAPAKPIRIEGVVTDRLLRRQIHTGEEGIVAVSSPALLRIHQPPAAVRDAMRVELARGAIADPSDAAARQRQLDRLRFAEVALVPGDAAYVPRGLVYDLVQPSAAMAAGTPSSRLRKPGILPFDIGVDAGGPLVLTPGALSASEQIRLAESDIAGDGESHRMPLTAWRWRFREFPDFSDRSRHPEPYVAAEHSDGRVGRLYSRAGRGWVPG